MILRRALLWGVCAALALTLTPALRANLPPPQPPAYALDRIRDLSASVRARRVLKDDRVLASLNLVVSVENGVANVSGPVPSEGIGRHAVTRLESVRGIREVKSNFYVDPPREDNPLGGLVRRPDAPQRIQVSKPDVDTGQLPVQPRSLAPAVPTRRQGGTATPKAPQLFTPRPVAGTSAESRPPPRRPESLLDRIAAIRRADDRFRTVPIAVDGSRIIVQAGSISDDIVRDLLSHLRRLPGVTEVQLASD